MKQEIKERMEKIQEGEVPKGYRKTKVGIIPDDWNNKKLLQIADYVDYRGKTPQKTNNGVFLVTAKNIKKGFIDYEISKEFVSENRYMDIMGRGLPKLGDVLITTEAPVGNVAQIDKENIALAQRVIKYRGKEYEIDNTYMKFYFLGFKFQKEILIESTGGTVQGIKGSRLHKLKVSFPKIEEQQKITEILSTWDKAIELKEKLIEEKKEFKRGLMQKLLTGDVRFPEFTGKWEEKKIIDILNYEQPNKYITENIVDKDETLTPVLTANKSFILGSTFDKNGIYTETPVIIFDDFTIDNKYIDFPFKIRSSAIKILKTKNDNVDIKFVYELMQFIKFPLGEHKRYYISEYQSVKIKIPKHIEQVKIVEVSNLLDSELNLFNTELNQLKEQKRGLMQLILTGIVRVEVD